MRPILAAAAALHCEKTLGGPMSLQLNRPDASLGRL